MGNSIGFVSDAVGGLFGGLADDLTQKNNYGALNPNIDVQNFANDIDYQRKLQEASVAKQNQIYEQQQALAGALSQQAAGSGPNPAMAQYQQNVNQAGAQAAGLISSQKGISPALAARMAAMQQSGAMQGAAASGAELQAKQQLAAQSALQNQQSAMQKGAETLGTQALTGQNIFQNAQSSQNQTATTGALGTNNINAAVAGQNTAATNQTMMGLMNSAGAAAGLSSGGGKYDGGEITLGDALKAGGKVPGKAKKSGDHPANDTVHAMLSPGEIVIPRSLVDDPDKAKKFIEQIKGKKSYGDVLKSKKKVKA